MNILILTTSHPYQTAGIVAYDIYRGLKSKEGIEVKMLVQIWDRYHNDDIVPIDSFSYYIFFK